MSYTGSGFDKRFRNLLVALESAAPPTPPVPPSGMLLWLAAATLAADYGNGDPVSTWRDTSGNSNDGTAAGAQRPTFTSASGIGGGSAAVFDNTQTQFLNLPAGFADFSAGLSLYIVHSPINTLAVAKALLGLSDNAVSSAYSFVIDTSNAGTGVIALQPGFSLVAATGVQAYAPCVFECHFPAGAPGSNVTAQVWLNHILIASGTMQVPLNTARNLNYIGDDAIAGVFRYGGDVAEVLLYAFALSPAQRVEVDDYINYAYGL